MEAVLQRNENDIVEAYWKTLSSLSRTVKLKLVSRLTDSVLKEEILSDSHTIQSRKAKVRRRSSGALTDAELEARFADMEMPSEPECEFSSADIIKANSGKTIKSIEKWL
jgi:hypothetical protein